MSMFKKVIEKISIDLARIILLLALIVGVLLLVRFCTTYFYRRSAIAIVAEVSRTFEVDNGKIAKMPADGEWITPNILYLKNGDWLAYSNRCMKPDWKIRDTFIAKGSDGKWYESNFHFCVHLCALRMNEQPADLAAFIKQYRLKPLTNHP